MTGARYSRQVLVEMCSSSHCSTARSNVGFPPTAGSANGAASSHQPPKRHAPCPPELTRSDHHLTRFADKPIETTVSVQLSGYFARNQD
jgi:hypothetical protein